MKKQHTLWLRDNLACTVLLLLLLVGIGGLITVFFVPKSWVLPTLIVSLTASAVGSVLARAEQG